MKQGIHPEYVDCVVKCSCGNTFTTRSTKPELKIDICNVCHPFYTGQQRFVDTGGRVQRFADKFGSAKETVAEREAAKKAAKAAAVADYTPAVTEDKKIKKKDGDLSIPLVRTKDILKALGENKRPGQILCGFSMETENVLENSRKKLESKHCDMICANSLKSAGAGFGTDTNIVTLITKNSEESLELMSKEQVAHKILDKLLAIVQP